MIEFKKIPYLGEFIDDGPPTMSSPIDIKPDAVDSFVNFSTQPGMIPLFVSTGNFITMLVAAWMSGTYIHQRPMEHKK